MNLELIKYDEMEKKFKKKYYIVVITILSLLAYIEISILKKDYFIQFFIIQAVLILPFLPNFLFLKTIKCPNCNKSYFTPFLASKEDIKSLLKSNPKCINCKHEAEIISEYKHMY